MIKSVTNPHNQLKLLEARIETLKKEGKLNLEDTLALKQLKEKAKLKAKGYVYDDRPVFGFYDEEEDRRRECDDKLIELHILGLTVAPMIPLYTAAQGASEYGAHVAAGRLVYSFFAPIGGIMVGVLAAKRAITNARARKMIFYESYANKLKKFLISKGDPTMSMSGTSMKS